MLSVRHQKALGMDKDHILSEIRRTAEENGGVPLGRNKFEKETGIKQWDWCGKYWSRWNDAIAAAGYDNPNKMQSAYSDEYLLGKLVELIQELDHFPTTPERRLKGHQDPQFPTHRTFSRFGKKADLVQAVLDYCQCHDVVGEVIDICKTEALKAKPKKQPISKREDVEYGFVYLMKSGKSYKIGRSKCAEKREYELRILLPEKLKLVHKIKTDDPVGIEQYWHNRFKDKRKNGEWFDLTASEINAFKRRKTM